MLYTQLLAAVAALSVFVPSSQAQSTTSRSFSYQLTYNASRLPQLDDIIKHAEKKFQYSPLLNNSAFFAKLETEASNIAQKLLSRQENRDANGNDNESDDSGRAAVAPLTNEQINNAWSASVGFGSPPQYLDMFLDTFSSGVVVYDHTCETCSLHNHTGFNGNESSTFEVVDPRNYGISYGTESSSNITGYIGSDNFVLGATEETSVNVTDQILFLTKNMSGYATTQDYDGIMGLSVDQDIGDIAYSGPFTSMVEQDLIDEPIVGFALKKENRSIWGPADDEDPYTGVRGEGGEVSFGRINHDYVRGDINYVRTSTAYAWGTTLDGVYSGRKSVMSTEDRPTVVFDTGATLIFTSTETAENIHSHIPGSNSSAGVWYVPCATSILSGAPPVFFEIGGHRYGIPAQDLAFRKATVSTIPDHMCVSGIQGGSAQFTILGDVFISNVYLVLEYHNGNTSDRYIGLGRRSDGHPLAPLF